MVNKFYHIVLLGNVGTVTSSQVSNCLFYFDWGQLPKSRWKVYITANIGTSGYSSNQQCLINVDFGQRNTELAKNIYGFYSGTSQADKNIFVGCFTNPSNAGSGNVFQINSYTNSPIYLDSTPTNNSFIQTLRNHGAGRGLFTPNAGQSNIILSMEQLDDPIPRTIKTSYKIVFNSLDGYDNGILGNLSYFYDWATIPKGEYLVRMTFITNGTSINETKYGGNSIYIDLGQGNSTVFFPTNQDNFNFRSKNFVGMSLYHGTNGLGQGSCLPIYSNNNTTKPIYLKSRPSNNDVNILILTDSKYQYGFGLVTSPSLYNYTLILDFNLLG